MIAQMTAMRPINNMSELLATEEHDLGRIETSNVNSAINCQNEILIGSIAVIHNIEVLYRKRMEESQYYNFNDWKNKKHLSKNVGVYAIRLSILIDAKSLTKCGLERYKNEIINYCINTYKKRNIAYVVLHNEEFIPHIHVMIATMSPEF